MKAAVLLAVLSLPLGVWTWIVCCSMNGKFYKEWWVSHEKHIDSEITQKECTDVITKHNLTGIFPCCQEDDNCCCTVKRLAETGEELAKLLYGPMTDPTHVKVSLEMNTHEFRCKGGYVNEQWLRNLRDDCTTIYGGLRIQNFKTHRFVKEVLAKFENLKTVKTLEGGLWIQNTKGLGKFEYLKNLHTITVRQHYNHVILDGSFPTQNLTSVNLRRLKRLLWSPQRPANNPLKRHSVQIYGSAENLVYEYKDLVRLLNVVHNNGLLANVMVKTFNNPKGFNADDAHANSSSNAVVRPKREL